MELTRLIEHMTRPSAYGEGGPVEVVQTHCSVVFLVGDQVFKVKKPIDLGFLDYSTLEKRRAMCGAEVELNRRLALDVYLGVVPIRRKDGEVAPDCSGDGAGEIVEWAVHMRRLPDDATLEAWLARDALGPTLVGNVARRIAEFHGTARRGADVSRFARFDVVAQNCRDNFPPLEAMVGSVEGRTSLARVRDSTEHALQAGRALIEARASRGLPCETHGDLRVDHVYLFPERDPPEDLCIVDCIEFDERFRFADPVTDIAFLAMDLQAHAAWDLAGALVDAYFVANGDAEGRRLMPLYLGYRATVRAKVDGIRACEPEVPLEQRDRARQSASAHLLLALHELSPPEDRPCLVLVGGLPGTGKSVLARALASRGFVWIRSDVVRKQLAGLAPDERGTTTFGTGLYTASWSDRTYAECLARAQTAWCEGGRVVVDATFIEARRRQPFIEAARRWCVPVQIMLCEAPPELVRARLAARRDDPSDADWTIYEAARLRYERPDPSEAPVTLIDAATTPEAMVERAEAGLRGRRLL